MTLKPSTPFYRANIIQMTTSVWRKLRNNSWGLNIYWFLPRVGPLSQIFYHEQKRGVKYRHKEPTRDQIYIYSNPINYFDSNRTNTVFEQPKQIMTRRMTDNLMVKRQGIKGETTIYTILQRKLKIEKH